MALAPTAFLPGEQARFSTANVLALHVPVTSSGPQLENPSFHVRGVSVSLHAGVAFTRTDEPRSLLVVFLEQPLYTSWAFADVARPNVSAVAGRSMENFIVRFMPFFISSGS